MTMENFIKASEKLARIIEVRHQGEDEQGAGGLWDFAGELAIAAGLSMRSNGLLSVDEVYADECGQESIYNALVELLNI